MNNCLLTLHTQERINIGITAKSVNGIGVPICIGAPMRHRSEMSAFFVPAVYGRLSGPLRRAVPIHGYANLDSLPPYQLALIGGSSQTLYRRT
jgi:hypothetical protein